MFNGRCEDMRPHGQGVLSVSQDPEGDYHIQIIVDDRNSPDDDIFKYHRVSLEFTTHCGHSPETVKALEQLKEAIDKDNQNHPEHAWPRLDKSD